MRTGLEANQGGLLKSSHEHCGTQECGAAVKLPPVGRAGHQTLSNCRAVATCGATAGMVGVHAQHCTAFCVQLQLDCLCLQNSDEELEDGSLALAERREHKLALHAAAELLQGRLKLLHLRAGHKQSISTATRGLECSPGEMTYHYGTTIMLHMAIDLPRLTSASGMRRPSSAVAKRLPVLRKCSSVTSCGSGNRMCTRG